jgi:hypothetical protein
MAVRKFFLLGPTQAQQLGQLLEFRMPRTPETRSGFMIEELDIKELNSVTVTKEELRLVVAESEKLRAQGMDADEASINAINAIIRLFEEKQPDKVIPIYSRLYALSKIISKQAAPGWTLGKGKDGFVLRHKALIDAAAIFPLSRIKDDISFELEGLLSKALELAEAEGPC